jgi:hypothetical protein
MVLGGYLKEDEVVFFDLKREVETLIKNIRKMGEKDQ